MPSREPHAELCDVVAAAPTSKFTCSLLFVHDLWVDCTTWRAAAGFLAHRGWRSHGLSWGAGQSPSPLNAGHAVRELDRLAASLPELPVIIGHGAGARLALASENLAARAVVAIAPLAFPASNLPRARPPLEARQLRALWFRRPVPPPRRTGASWFGSVSPPLRAAAPTWIDDLRDLSVAAAHGPRLVVVPREDRVCRPDDQRRLAEVARTEWVEVSGGHAVAYADGWDECAGVVHRWLVRRLGAELLAFLDDEAVADDRRQRE